MSDILMPFIMIGCGDSRCITCRILKECYEMFHYDAGFADYESEAEWEQAWKQDEIDFNEKYKIFRPFIHMSNCGMKERKDET